MAVPHRGHVVLLPKPDGSGQLLLDTWTEESAECPLQLELSFSSQGWGILKGADGKRFVKDILSKRVAAKSPADGAIYINNKEDNWAKWLLPWRLDKHDIYPKLVVLGGKMNTSEKAMHVTRYECNMSGSYCFWELRPFQDLHPCHLQHAPVVTLS